MSIGLLEREAGLALSRLRLRKAEESTIGAVRWRDPRIRPYGFQLELGNVCDRMIDSVVNQTGMRVLLSAPPRHGKTELVGRAMPIHAMLRMRKLNRTANIVYCTSSDERAEEVSFRAKSAVMRIFEETGDKWFAPGRKWSTNEWETEGGITWMGIGWTASTGGIGGNILLGDDMIGTSETYRSVAKRERLKRVFQEDLLSRLMNYGVAANMETRRGRYDTTGWLHDTYGDTWENHVWKCYDKETGYLWPEQYGERWRATMPHLTESSAIWRSIYQQEPIVEGGTIIPPEWLKATYSEPPEYARHLCSRIVIGVDLASTGKTKSDACAFVVIGIRGAYRDILHVVNKKCDFVEQKKIMRELAATWAATDILVEKASNGEALIADLQSEVRGIDGRHPKGDKVARLMPWLGTIAAGQLRYPANPLPWVGPWREQLEAFSGVEGEPDDMVDATVWALVAGEGSKIPTASAVSKAFKSIF